MRERQETVASVDWDKYQLEVHEPKSWVQLLARFRGPELAIVGVTAIAIVFVLTTRTELLAVPLAAIAAVLILGLATLLTGKREGDGSSSAHSSKDTTESRYARRDQATA